MLNRYPVLVLVALSAVGGATAVALLFSSPWLAAMIYAGTAACVVVVVALCIRRDSGRE
jgi:hypothetical protein